LSRPLDATSNAPLRSSYQTRFFIRIALSESTALMAWVAFITTANPALYLVGAAFCAYGFARLVPSKGHLAADQEALNLRGTRLSLLDALLGADD
jgi:hypothetical protein